LSERFVPIEDIRQAAKAFSKASKESRLLLKGLEETTKNLTDKWEGATSQFFYKHYQSFQPQMEGAAAHMDLIAKELDAIANRYESADR
jgi:WXG100 family type VII secretion target